MVNVSAMQSRVTPRPAEPAPADIAPRVRERQLRLAFENGRFAIFPLAISALCFTGLLAGVVPRAQLTGWLIAMLALIGARILLTLSFQAPDSDLTRWLRYQRWVMAAIGLLYGLTAWWVPLPSQAWLLAVVNLWLGGLAVGGLMGQGIVPGLGLAFALPALAPMMIRLFLTGDPTLTALGIGNLMFYLYVCSIVIRAQNFTLSEIRHRARYETLAASLEVQRQRSDTLVAGLTQEIARRKRIQVALKVARDNARRQSERDHLTDLANQRTLERVLRREWLRAQQQQKPLSLVLCDIDRFRAYNERYGHHAGDLCLARVARLLVALTAREDALVARFGGEEFALLLPDTGEYVAQEIAEAIRSTIYEQTILHGASDAERVVTASCGVATILPEPTQRPTALVEAAALALKRAKAAGRNCVYTLAVSAARDKL